MWCRTGLDDNGTPDNVVAEIFEYDPTDSIFSGFKIYKLQGPLVVYVTIGYLVDEDGNFSPPNMSMFIAQLSMVTATRRWGEMQNGRVKYKDFTFITDDNTTSKISQAVQLGDKLETRQPGAFSTRWKAPEGFITLDYEDVINVGLLLAGSVQEQFAKEDRIMQLLNDNSTTDAVEKLEAWTTKIDEEWPLEFVDPIVEPSAEQ